MEEHFSSMSPTRHHTSYSLGIINLAWKGRTEHAPFGRETNDINVHTKFSSERMDERGLPT